MEQSNGDQAEAAIENERAKSSFSYREDVAPGLTIEMDLKSILASTSSKYQKLDVVDTYFGKVRNFNHCYVF